MLDRYPNRIFPMLGILASATLILGCGKQAAPRPPSEVSVITVQTGRAVLTSELPGRVSAFLVAEVHPQVSGIITKRLFTEGSDVKAGTILYQIDPSPFQAVCASA